jgi:hypothetical protein
MMKKHGGRSHHLKVDSSVILIQLQLHIFVPTISKQMDQATRLHRNFISNGTHPNPKVAQALLLNFLKQYEVSDSKSDS